VKRFDRRALDAWTDHDLEGLKSLGFEPQGRLEDGVHTIAVLTGAEPPTYVLLYEGTPYVEFQSFFKRGYAAVTTDTPLRVDEFGEHEGRRERHKTTSQHRFLEPQALFEAHRQLVGELSPRRGALRDTEGLDGAEKRLRDMEGRMSWRDLQAIITLILVFVATIALAAGALAYFGD